MGMDILLFGSKLGQLDLKIGDCLRSDLRSLSRLIVELAVPDTPEAQRLMEKYDLGLLPPNFSYDEEEEKPVSEHPDCWLPTADVLGIYERILSALRQRDPDAVSLIEHIRKGIAGRQRAWPARYENALAECEDVVQMCRNALTMKEEYLTHLMSP